MSNDDEKELLQHELFDTTKLKIVETYSKNKKSYQIIITSERELCDMQIYLALNATAFEKGNQLGVNDDLPEPANRFKELDN